MNNSSHTTSSSKDSLQPKINSRKLANYQKPRLSSFRKKTMRINNLTCYPNLSTLINNEMLVKARAGARGVKSMN